MAVIGENQTVDTSGHQHTVDDEWEDCDVEDEVTFMLFTSRDLPPSP